MNPFETLRQSLSLFDEPEGAPMKRTLETVRADVRRRLRRETASAAVICGSLIALGVLSASDSLPALHDDMRISGFLAGFLTGLFAVAGVITIRRIVDMRRALRDDAALRRLHAKEHDELQAHMEREIARTFIQIMPALAVVAIFAGALVSLEAMAAVAVTLVFLSLALLAVKLYVKAGYRHEVAEDA